MTKEKKLKRKIPLKDIKFNEKLYPRTHFDWKTVYDYQESMRTGEQFPPLVLAQYKKQLILVDGKHRLEAYKNLKMKQISAEIYIGWNYKKIYLESVKRNMTHGRPLSAHEKRNIAMNLKKMKYNMKNISKIVQIPLDKIEDFTGQTLTNSLTGEEIVSKPFIKHLSGKKYNDTEFNDIKNSQKNFYSQNQKELLDQINNIIEKGMLDYDNKEVMKKTIKLKKLLKKNK